MFPSETRYNSLSVRGLYKYVLKSMKASPHKQAPGTEPMTDSSLHLTQSRSRREPNSSRSVGTISDPSIQDNDDNNDSDSYDDEQSRKTANKQAKGSRVGQGKNTKSGRVANSKNVSFGGPEGPFVTEHPAAIPELSVLEENGSQDEDTKVNGVKNSSAQAHRDYYGHDGPVTYRERLGGYLHPRDMRRLVSPFSASNEPELIVRRHVMLLNFDPLRAIILRDRLLVLVPDGADSLLVDLEKRVRGGTKEIERSIFGESVYPSHHSQAESSNVEDSQHTPNVSDHGHTSIRQSTATVVLNKVTQSITGGASALFGSGENHDDATAADTAASTATPGFDDAASEFQEWDEMENRELSFELSCLDAVLGSVVGILGKDSNELQSNAIKAMDKILLQPGGGQADELLRHMKNSIKEMTSRVKGFIRAMNMVLDETQDMALMNLSRLLTHPERFIQPVPEEILNEESDEPELILEAHLQHAFSLTNSLDLMRGEIQTTHELMNQRLDAVRNRLLLANMLISIGSLCVAAASYIGSMFGMNVPIWLDDDPTAFAQIVMGTCLGMLSMVLAFGLILWYAGILPNLRS
jgi:Mg2+ and Co2+ transporter CorA